MKHFTYYTTVQNSKPNFINKFGRFAYLFVLLFTLFKSISLSAQVVCSKEKLTTQLISIIDDAKIYSAEESFNQHIIQKKIIRNNTTVSYIDVSDKTYLVLESKKATSKEIANLASYVKAVEIQKKENFVKKLQKQIVQYEKRKGNFILDNLKSYPSSTRFSTKQNGNKDYLNLQTGQHNFSKFIQVKIGIL